MIDKLIQFVELIKSIDTSFAAVIVVGLGFLVLILALVK